MVLTNSAFYHAEVTGSATIMRHWTYPFTQTTSDYSRSMPTIVDYTAEENGTSMSMLTSGVIYTLNALNGSAGGLLSPSSTKKQTFIVGGDLWVYQYQYSSSSDIVSHYPGMAGSGTHHTLPPIRGTMKFTPDHSKFIIWSTRTEVYIYDTATVTLLSLFNASYVTSRYT